MSAKKRRIPRVVRDLESKTPDKIRVVRAPPKGPPNTQQVRRLSWNCQSDAFHPEALAEAINRVPDVAYFCDANLFIGPTDDRIWHSLLAEKRIFLIPQIAEELQWWLANPKYNLIAHAHVKSLFDGAEDSKISPLTLPDPPLIQAIEYYVNLLGFRKHLAPLLHLQLQNEGKPSDSLSVNTQLQQMVGERGFHIGTQSQKCKVPDHLFNDECLVVAAFVWAIQNGQDVVILTKDEGLLDQFRKALWLLDMHFRAMLLAEDYASRTSDYETRLLPNELPKMFNDKEMLMIRKPSDWVDELLPKEFELATVSCIWMNDAATTQMTFCADRNMARLFRVKSETNGLSTNRLAGRNCHILHPFVSADESGAFAILAQDDSEPLPCGAGLARWDMVLACLNAERIEHIRVIDRDKLWLPPQYS
jgi:hypothetical protein